MNRDISIWTRGIDRDQFNPEPRSDSDWRRSHGIAADEMVVAFLGRLVMEKGLDVFADAIDARGRAGRQPQRAGDRRRPGARLVRRAPARRDLHRRADRHRPRPRARSAPTSSSTRRSPRAFGNVTLEAMACALPVVAAAAIGRDQPGRRRRHRHAGRRPARSTSLPTRSTPMPRDPGLARPPRRGRPRLRPRRMDWDADQPRGVKVYARVIERRRRAAKRSARWP